MSNIFHMTKYSKLPSFEKNLIHIKTKFTREVNFLKKSSFMFLF